MFYKHNYIDELSFSPITGPAKFEMPWESARYVKNVEVHGKPTLRSQALHLKIDIFIELKMKEIC